MPRLNFLEDLGENLFDSNAKFEDCECGSATSACVNHRGESVFDESEDGRDAGEVVQRKSRWDGAKTILAGKRRTTTNN